MPTILIKNGSIVDGTGSEIYKGHVYISGDRIDAVTSLNSDDGKDILRMKADTIIDADGLAVCPGFIDCHSHFDWVLPLPDHHEFLFPVIEQGITTVVTGNCGFSPAPVNDDSREINRKSSEFVQERALSFEWDGMGSFLDHLNSMHGLMFNNVQLAGHGPLHLMAVMDNVKQPDSRQRALMVAKAHEALDEGAFGLSMGLMYPPDIFSKKEDLTEIAKVAADRDRILTVHIKALSKYSMAYPIIPFLGKPHNLKALEEILEIGLKTGVKLQISHFIFVGKKSWPTVHKAVNMIENARDKGVEVIWDIYPHFCGNSYLSVFIAEWFLKNLAENLENAKAIKRLKFETNLAARLLGFKLSDIQIMQANYPAGQKYNGMNLEDIGKQEGIDPLDAMLKIVKESDGKALQLTHGYSGDDDNEWVLEKLMKNDLCLFETDTLLKSSGFPNPASYGAFPRILGRFVREKKTLSLSDAINKMTGKTARWVGIKNRGEIKPGNFADIVVFNPDTIADNTTLIDTAKRPTGIEYVFIN
ncbi:MAG: amidohydrolase family protein, partial [Desulfobacterales bacterium]|nr:amidohydrolase family protein [Desulfobacterales bacterium]